MLWCVALVCGVVYSGSTIVICSIGVMCSTSVVCSISMVCTSSTSEVLIFKFRLAMLVISGQSVVWKCPHTALKSTEQSDWAGPDNPLDIIGCVRSNCYKCKWHIGALTLLGNFCVNDSLPVLKTGGIHITIIYNLYRSARSCRLVWIGECRMHLVPMQYLPQMFLYPPPPSPNHTHTFKHQH